MEWTKTKDLKDTQTQREKILTYLCFPFKGEGGNDGVVNPLVSEYPQNSINYLLHFLLGSLVYCGLPPVNNSLEDSSKGFYPFVYGCFLCLEPSFE